MKKIVVLILSIGILIFFISCNAKSTNKLTQNISLPNEKVEIIEIVSDENTESYNVWAIGGEPSFLLYVNIIGSDIQYYSIKGVKKSEGTFFIKLTSDNFYHFREALEKFIEWENVAKENKVTTFNKQIPISISSNEIEWYAGTFEGEDYKATKDKLLIDFFFNWSNYDNEGKFEIVSNTIYADNLKSTFKIIKKDIKRSQAKFFLERTTGEYILIAIEKGRQEELEKKRQSQLKENLFN